MWCWICQWMIDWRNSGRAGAEREASSSRWVARHVAACRRCRAYFDGLQKLERELSAGPGVEVEPGGEELTDRVMRAVRREKIASERHDSLPQTARRPIPLGALTAAVAGVVMVVVGGVIFVQWMRSAPQPTEAVAPVIEEQRMELADAEQRPEMMALLNESVGLAWPIGQVEAAWQRELALLQQEAQALLYPIETDWWPLWSELGE